MLSYINRIEENDFPTVSITITMPRYFKVTSSNAVNRNHQLVTGLNEVDNFDSSELECSQGLYFCELKHVLYWARILDCDHVFDVEIPDGAKVIHFDDKSRADKLILSNHRPIHEICDLLWSVNREGHDLLKKANDIRILVKYTIRYGSLELIKGVSKNIDTALETRGVDIPATYLMDHAAWCERLDVLKYFHNIGKSCSHHAMNWAARKGRLGVVEYLHSIGADCTTDAMDWAADEGRLDVIKYLHSIGKSCTHRAMFWALRNGHLDVVEYLRSLEKTN